MSDNMLQKDELPARDGLDDKEIIRRFALLPKIYKGTEITFAFTTGMDAFHSVAEDECEALRLEHGATITHWAPKDSPWFPIWFSVYASGDVADRVLGIPKGSIVTARGTLIYGTSVDIEHGEDGVLNRTRAHKGVRIDGIVKVNAPE